MKSTFCPKCSTQLIISESIENIKIIKCPECKVSFENPHYFKKPIYEQNYNINNAQQKTDPFAIISFAAGCGGFVILPIFFVPIGYISSIVSYYRLKEDIELKGHGLRITGAILTTLNIFWLMYQFKVGIFKK